MKETDDLWVEPAESRPGDGDIVWIDLQSEWTPSPWIAIYRGGKFWNYQQLDREISHVYGWRPIEKPKPPACRRRKTKSGESPMKVTVHPTARVCEVHTEAGRPSTPMRIWEGVTDAGTPVQLLVARVAPTIPEPLPTDILNEFECALRGCAPPKFIPEVFPLRMVI